ncbi:MAG TPA: hypothetical protein EYG92_06850 [Lutibacter sp.]|nr:hypothetical protein [Lutibacter sp.]
MKFKIISLFFLLIFSFFRGYSQNSDTKMQELLQEKRIFNQTQKIKNGFRIQLYNGMSQTRAEGIRGTFLSFFPEIGTHLLYEQPEWKAQTTTFRTELEAYKIWLKVREEFQGTFVFEVRRK